MSEAMLKDFIARYKAMIADLEKSVEGFEKELAEVTDNSVVVDETFIKNNLDVRTGGGYRAKSIYLNDFSYDWRLEKDDCSMLCLIPTKKGVAK